jgi:hypothetical protein
LGGEFAERAAPHRLEHLGEFPRDHRRTVAEDRRRVGEHLGEAVGRLEQHQRAGDAGDERKAGPPGRALRRQKAFEEEPVRRQARDDERRGHGGGAGDRRNREPFGNGGLDQFVARVGDERRAGVGHERQRLTLAYPVDHTLANRVVRVLVIGDQRRGDAVVGKKRLGDPRVLCQHGVGRRKRGERPERDVLQVADWCGDHVEAVREGLGLGGKTEGGEDAPAVLGHRPSGAVVDSTAHRTHCRIDEAPGGDRSLALIRTFTFRCHSPSEWPEAAAAPVGARKQAALRGPGWHVLCSDCARWRRDCWRSRLADVSGEAA